MTCSRQGTTEFESHPSVEYHMDEVVSKVQFLKVSLLELIPRNAFLVLPIVDDEIKIVCIPQVSRVTFVSFKPLFYLEYFSLCFTVLKSSMYEEWYASISVPYKSILEVIFANG